MYKFEKEIAQLERKVPHITYKAVFVPLNDSAKFSFSKAQSKFEKGNEGYSTTGEGYKFYYNDPNESELERVNKVIDGAIAGASNFIAGISHPKQGVQHYNLINMEGGRHNNLEYKRDYDIKVKKVVHDVAKIPSYEDIKKL